MDKLPYEILYIIISKLDIINKFKLRLVNKSFNDVFLMIKNEAYDFICQQDLRIRVNKISYEEPESENLFILIETDISYNSIIIKLAHLFNHEIYYKHYCIKGCYYNKLWDNPISDSSYELIKSIQDKLRPLLYEIILELNKDSKLYFDILNSIKIE